MIYAIDFLTNVNKKNAPFFDFFSNTKVKIEGLDGIYLVKDKMHARWKNKIDIYMGKDIKKAQEWGVKKLSIQYVPKKNK